MWLPQSGGKVDLSDGEHGHVLGNAHGSGWYEPHNNRQDQNSAAYQHLEFIQSKCSDMYNKRQIQEERWTNDPLVFPLDEHEHPATQREFAQGIVPFPPNDQQYYISGIYDPQKSYLTPAAKPGHSPYSEGAAGAQNSSWVRLCDFAQHDGGAHLFSEQGQKGYHSGRVMQGALDNGYLIEALNAITLRPKLVRHLFHNYDVAKSIYIVRLYKHGMWHRVEVDDYVPVSPPPQAGHQNHGPICCTSEHFPHVLWPSLVEKAVAKLFTKRGQLVGDNPDDVGGWEAIGGGGRLEDALVMLTGGVAGRFRTREVSADRLFIYLFEHQTDTLFVCRVNQPSCEMSGTRLNPYYPYSVNRAVAWEGRLYVQLFSAAPTCFDGGLEDISVPYGLAHCEDYPEHQDAGFFWCDINDFHLYFDTIFECHLTNSPACALPGMPPSRFSSQMSIPPPLPDVAHPNAPYGRMMPPSSLKVAQNVEGANLPFFEQVFANPGVITKHNAPEFNIEFPGSQDGCEIICSFDQYDARIMMDSPVCQAPAEILLKAYVKVNDAVSGGGTKDLWQMVCKSNWLPVNHSMVALHCRHGCKIKVVAEFGAAEGEAQHCEKAVFRCYCTAPNFQVYASVATRRHALGELPPGESPGAVKWSLVGSVDPSLMENPDKPMEFNPATDGLRKAEHDVNNSWKELKEECSIM